MAQVAVLVSLWYLAVAVLGSLWYLAVAVLVSLWVLAVAMWMSPLGNCATLHSYPYRASSHVWLFCDIDHMAVAVSPGGSVWYVCVQGSSCPCLHSHICDTSVCNRVCI